MQYIITYKTVRMSSNQHKLYQNNQKMMDCKLPLGMIHFSFILHHNMGMKYAEEPFNMGMFFLPKASFKMGTFSNPTHTSGHFYTGVAPSPLGLSLLARTDMKKSFITALVVGFGLSCEYECTEITKIKKNITLWKTFLVQYINSTQGDVLYHWKISM